MTPAAGALTTTGLSSFSAGTAGGSSTGAVGRLAMTVGMRFGRPTFRFMVGTTCSLSIESDVCMKGSDVAASSVALVSPATKS